MRNGRILLTALMTGALLLGLSAQAHATVVEKVVAVVGEKAILLSELRSRARPFLAQIYQRLPPGAQQAEAVDQLSRQVLARMIDDVLERQIADKHHISVTSEEIDGALERLAGMQNLSVDQLMSEAIHSGLTAQEYRDEIRRQLLEGKLLELRVKGRVRVTDEEMRGLYNRLVRDERAQLGYSLQWIVLRVPRGSSAETVRARRALADRLVNDARGGADFASMARTYSDDKDTRELGGELGPQKPGALEEPIERVAVSLDTGQVSAPFNFADAMVIIKLTGRDASKYGAFEDLREQLAQRVYAEQLEKARRKWLDNIKRGMHIDQRL